jgi:hypothetical protein
MPSTRGDTALLSRATVTAWSAEEVSAWGTNEGIPVGDIRVLRSEEISGDVLWLAAASLSASGFVVANVPSRDREWIEPLVAKLSLGGRVRFMRALMRMAV